MVRTCPVIPAKLPHSHPHFLLIPSSGKRSASALLTVPASDDLTQPQPRIVVAKILIQEKQVNIARHDSIDASAGSWGTFADRGGGCSYSHTWRAPETQLILEDGALRDGMIENLHVAPLVNQPGVLSFDISFDISFASIFVDAGREKVSGERPDGG